MPLRLGAALLLILLASCTQPSAQEPDLIVDQCYLTEFQNECHQGFGGENDNPELRAVCMERAKQQATRIRAGVPPECLIPGAEPRLW